MSPYEKCNAFKKYNSKARFPNHTLHVYNIHVKYLISHVALYFA